MIDRVSLPDYERIAESIGPYNPSELHGMLCGMLCFDNALTSDGWLAHLSEDAASYSVFDRDSLRVLFDATSRQISDDDYSFMLLLPDDEMNLSVRAESLANWCQGFLAGLGLAGLHDAMPLSAESREFLDDISHIARLGFDGDKADEDDEIAYAEIVEYLRMGVLLVGGEFELGSLPRSSTKNVH